jgi:hypothetical protein
MVHGQLFTYRILPVGAGGEANISPPCANTICCLPVCLSACLPSCLPAKDAPAKGVFHRRPRRESVKSKGVSTAALVGIWQVKRSHDQSLLFARVFFFVVHGQAAGRQRTELTGSGRKYNQARIRQQTVCRLSVA